MTEERKRHYKECALRYLKISEWSREHKDIWYRFVSQSYEAPLTTSDISTLREAFIDNGFMELYLLLIEYAIDPLYIRTKDDDEALWACTYGHIRDAVDQIEDYNNK